MSYTRRSLNIITLLLTVILFLLIFYINLQIVSLFKPENKQIYSKVVPYHGYTEQKAIQTSYVDEINGSMINKQEEPKKISHREENESKSTFSKSLKEVQEITKNEKLQRDIINENKEVSWRIKIPKLNLDVHIKEGTDKDTLLSAVGHFEKTSKWDGNVCLAAHNRGYNCNFFKDIHKLKIGDEIIYTIGNKKKIYKVTENKIIQETDWKDLENKEKNCVTLITCVENRRECRRCVQAVEVSQSNT